MDPIVTVVPWSLLRPSSAGSCHSLGMQFLKTLLICKSWFYYCHSSNLKHFSDVKEMVPNSEVSSPFCVEPRSHGRTNFIPRDERSLKMQEHLKKRLKDRQASGHTNNKLNSPPSSPHKAMNSANATIQNGNGKGQQGAAGALKQKQLGKTKASPDAEVGGRLHWKGWNKVYWCCKLMAK